MSVSVLTLVRNRRANLENLMIGLGRSTVVPDELIVVHMNQPTYAGLPLLPFPVRQVQLIDEHDPIPLARARNLAARTAGSEWLLFLDVDCVPHPDLIGEMTAQQQRAPGLLMGEIRYLPEGALADDWTLEDLETKGVPHPARPRVEPGERLPVDNYTLFWSLCFSMRRSTFVDTIGGLDEDFRGYGSEDTDFAFMVRDAGIPFAIVGARAYHQYHHVYRPPLNNFQNIVTNANVFRQKWGRWAMESWLTQFTERGYIDWQEAQTHPIEVLREPTAEDLAAARKTDGQGW